MLQNYFKNAFRFFTKNPFISLISILGLTIGLWVVSLTFLYSYSELRVDRFYSNSDQIFRIITSEQGDSEKKVKINPPFANVVRDNISGIKSSVRMVDGSSELIRSENSSIISSDYILADPEIMNVFDLKIISGNQNTLSRPFEIAITEEFAKELDLKKPVTGKELIIDDKSYTITSLIEKVPEYSSIQFDFIISYKTLYETKSRMMREYNGGWNLSNTVTYFLLEENVNPRVIQDQISAVLANHTDQDYVLSKTYTLEPFSKQYLYSNAPNPLGKKSDIKYVYLFAGISFLVLSIAVFNYVNLQTAQYSRRTKEAGARKALGASRNELFIQYMSEGVFISFCAALLSVFILTGTLPHVNNYLLLDLTFSDIPILPFIIGLVVVTFIIAIVSGWFPSYLLSKYSASELIQRRTGVLKNSNLRKSLITIQYAISVFLLTGIFIVNQQLHFLTDSDLGIEINNQLVIEDKAGLSETELKVYKEKLSGYAEIEDLTLSSSLPASGIMSSSITFRSEEQDDMYYLLGVDAGFFETYSIQLKDGEWIYRNDATSNMDKALINEEAARTLSMEDPIGEKLTYWGSREVEIVGVVKNFHFKSMHQAIEPMIILPGEALFYNYLTIHTGDQPVEQILDIAKNEWQLMFGGTPFSYSFLKENFESYYTQDQRTANLINLLGFLSVLIAGMGLMGMTMFSVEKRKKELSIRKVYGAGISKILMLINKEFMILVVIGICISVPVSFYSLSKWLQQFTYHVNIEFQYFLISALIAILVAFITVSWHAFQAARLNPIENLRKDA